MDQVLVMNCQAGVECYGDGEEGFRMMINIWDEKVLTEAVLGLHTGIMKMDFEEIQLNADNLKSLASFMFANRLKDIAVELRKKGAAKESISSVLNEYIELLNRAREVKKEIASFFDRPISSNIAAFDTFETQVREAFPDGFNNTLRED